MIEGGMRIFIEGYDTTNWGDALMAAASALLAGELQPHAEIIFPRRLPFKPEHLEAILAATRYRAEPSSRPLWSFARPRADFDISAPALKAGRGDAVLFCNGFIFGDFWRAKWIRAVARSMKRLNARGVRAILMPQSFGPFEDQEKAALVRMAVENAALVCARDAQSLSYLQRLGCAANLLSSIDYTGLLNNSSSFALGGERHNRLVIIPNVKIGERFGGAAEESYVRQLADLAGTMRHRQGMRTVILAHTEHKDDDLAARLAGLCEAGAVVRGDPLEMRRFIGSSRAVIASRFHGLKNALAQNVPALSIGWSHKYTELMKVYGLSDYSVDVTSGPPLAQYFRRLLAAENALAEKLRAANERIADGPYAALRNGIGAALSAQTPPAQQKSRIFRPFRARETEFAS
jgi:polysaccharide pyruvyl transferase WcaK-like protein